VCAEVGPVTPQNEKERGGRKIKEQERKGKQRKETK
jgi:hypothetical protein